jgi:hypothetical protein
MAPLERQECSVLEINGSYQYTAQWQLHKIRKGSRVSRHQRKQDESSHQQQDKTANPIHACFQRPDSIPHLRIKRSTDNRIVN